MLAGDTVYGCFGHFAPNGCRGISTVRWTFFKETDPTDSVSVTAHYSTFPATTGNKPVPEYTFNVPGYGQPDGQVAARYALPPGKTGRAELRNITGKIVAATGSLFLSGSVSLSTGNLATGLFFCTLVVDGRPVITRKVSVYR